MNTATAVDDSPLDSDEAEWRILRDYAPNVILEGPVAATDAVLHLLQPHIHEPIVWRPSRVPLALPSGTIGTLILQDAATLSKTDQNRLLTWHAGPGEGAQIISRTERSLFALVQSGRFDETLYYRLNIMLLQVESSSWLANATRLIHRRAESAREPRLVQNG